MVTFNDQAMKANREPEVLPVIDTIKSAATSAVG